MIDAENAAGGAAPTPEPMMSPLARARAIFLAPTHAWSGLRERAQWWFPMVFLTVVAALTTALLHQRAMLPMLLESWNEQVASGQMPAEQVDRLADFFGSPAGLAVTVGQQMLFTPVVMLLTALVIWFGVGFVLGTKLKYRQALEVAAWAQLVTLPAVVITVALAWMRETMRGIHVGLGALLPAMDEPTRLGVGLRAFLDALGPLAIWYVAVGILGAAALSGAPRKSVAWVLGVLYVAIALFLSGLAAMLTPVS